MGLGKRIRLIRKQQNRTLDEIATQCGFTKSLLSKIENEVSTPPITTLMKIADALGVKVSDLLDENNPLDTVFTQSDSYRDQDTWIKTEKGYSFYPFATGRASKLMQPYYFIARKDDIKKHVFSHKGEEFIFVLEGIMKYKIGAVEYTLNPGDSLYFTSLEEHTLTPMTDEVKYIGVFSGN